MARSTKTTGSDLLVDEGRIIAGQLVGWRCPCCNKRIDRSACKRTQIQMDHWRPCALGGDAVVEGNLIPLCGMCNAVKNDRVDHLGWIADAITAATGAKTTLGGQRKAPRVLARLLETRDALTAALKEAGIW